VIGIVVTPSGPYGPPPVRRTREGKPSRAGRSTRAVRQAREELQQYAPPFVVDYFLEVWNAVRPDVRDTVQQITGRPARTFQQWARENTDLFR
jgi:hypothetical protein